MGSFGATPPLCRRNGRFCVVPAGMQCRIALHPTYRIFLAS